MRRLSKRTHIIAGGILILAGIILLIVVNITPKDVYSQVRKIARPYAFNYVSYEIDAVLYAPNEPALSDDESRERILAEQIRTVLDEHEIPSFPPLVVRLEEPPHILVVSPRDHILYMDRMMLRQELSTEQMEGIEAEVDELGVSSLVLGLGGFGATYPPIVSDAASIRFIIDATTEEWLHQYLAFRPLGFRYLLDSLGIRRDPEIITMNETFAGIFSREIGEEVYKRYYANIEKEKQGADPFGFDFDKEMRETRRVLDELLEKGLVNEAEQYLEHRRQFFEDNGYYIRKLNQAYFAFYGIYGHDPASVSPIFEDLTQLREDSASLKEFLDTVAAMKDYSELQRLVGQ